MQSIKISFHLIILLVFVMNNLYYPEDKIKSKEGFINVAGGKVWYRIDGNGDKTPLLLLHGGPGVPSEFNVTGVLKDFDRTNRLGEIKIPILLMCGEFDEATPETVKYYHSLITDSKFVVIKNSAHETMNDNPEENNKAISDFLNELEK